MYFHPSEDFGIHVGAGRMQLKELLDTLDHKNPDLRNLADAVLRCASYV